MVNMIVTFLMLGVVSCTSIPTTREFKVKDIQGWKVYFEKKIYENSEVRRSTEDILRQKLEVIKRQVPKTSLRYIQKIKVWISNEANYPFRKNEYSTFVYHVSSSWLEQNGLPDKFENSIHLINPDHFINTAKNFTTQPMVVLHELSHAFHYGCLKIQNQAVLGAFKKAKSQKLYLSVYRINSNTKQRAYAISNHGEYFAELTEAYFGKNDYYPFTRDELKNYDPQGYQMIEQLWGAGCES
jgi:hypothetical protein